MDYNHDLTFFSEIKKANCNDNGRFVEGTHIHFSWGNKRSLFFGGIQEVSAHRLRKEPINYNLYLFA